MSSEESTTVFSELSDKGVVTITLIIDKSIEKHFTGTGIYYCHILSDPLCVQSGTDDIMKLYDRIDIIAAQLEINTMKTL